MNVTLGEMRGEGVNAGYRMLWDGETDSVASDSFTNVHSSLSLKVLCLKDQLRTLSFALPQLLASFITKSYTNLHRS